MKKRIFRLSVILLLCALCVLLLCACGDEQPDGETKEETPASKLTFELNEDGQSYTVTGLSDEGETLTELVIPATYQGLPVTSIGEEAFVETPLISVTIGNNVASIGNWAFGECRDLTSVTIGNSVTNIGEGAFCECNILASVTIGKNVKSIGESTFDDCINLTSIVIPNNVTSIGEKAFNGCEKLVEVYNLSSLTIVAGSEDNGYVGYYAKAVHTSLAEESILYTTPDGYIFWADGEQIWLMGYNGTDSVLTLPGYYQNKPYDIYRYAFDGRFNLTSVTIPDGVTSIGEDAFQFCTGLTTVTIGNSVISIGSDAFYYCRDLAFITYAGTKAEWNAIGKGDRWKEDTLVDSDIIHCTDGDYFDATSVFNMEGNTITGLTHRGGEYTTLNIPASINGVPVTGIGDYAFDYCRGLTSVTIPNSVTSIGGGAFHECTGLTSITIPNSVTSIGPGAFSGCTGLTSVTFANTSGWYLAGDNAATDGEPVRVTDPATNATNLTENYVWCYWKR